jgi:hypothetical protein
VFVKGSPVLSLFVAGKKRARSGRRVVAISAHHTYLVNSPKGAIWCLICATCCICNSYPGADGDKAGRARGYVVVPARDE